MFTVIRNIKNNKSIKNMPATAIILNQPLDNNDINKEPSALERVFAEITGKPFDDGEVGELNLALDDPGALHVSATGEPVRGDGLDARRLQELLREEFPSANKEEILALYQSNINEKGISALESLGVALISGMFGSPTAFISLIRSALSIYSRAAVKDKKAKIERGTLPALKNVA